MASRHLSLLSPVSPSVPLWDFCLCSLPPRILNVTVLWSGFAFASSYTQWFRAERQTPSQSTKFLKDTNLLKTDIRYRLACIVTISFILQAAPMRPSWEQVILSCSTQNPVPDLTSSKDSLGRAGSFERRPIWTQSEVSISRKQLSFGQIPLSLISLFIKRG